MGIRRRMEQCAVPDVCLLWAGLSSTSHSLINYRSIDIGGETPLSWCINNQSIPFRWIVFQPFLRFGSIARMPYNSFTLRLFAARSFVRRSPGEHDDAFCCWLSWVGFLSGWMYNCGTTCGFMLLWCFTTSSIDFSTVERCVGATSRQHPKDLG